MKTSQFLAKVKSKFEAQGITLTQKRSRILEILCHVDQSASAYQIVDIYKELYGESIPPMSVYRILDFLIDVKAVHKLESVNQFILCEHIACDHEHMKAQFLICDDCHAIEEIVLDQNIVDSLKQSILDTKFTLKSSQLELHGLCADCAADS